MEPLFLFDVSSPYAYLAASRVDRVLPVRAEWRPVAFGIMIRVLGKVPWSLSPGREAGLAEISRRAAAYGLPEFRLPEGWPRETYSLLPLRALVLAEDGEELRRMALGFFHTMFAEGRHLADPAAVRGSLDAAGFDGSALVDRLGSDPARSRLRAHTDDALARGVTGVPTVIAGGRIFWGDDRLEDAAGEHARAG